MKREIFDCDAQPGMPEVLRGLVGQRVSRAWLIQDMLLVGFVNGHWCTFQRAAALGTNAVEVLEGVPDLAALDTVILAAGTMAQPLAELLGEPFTEMRRNLLFFGRFCLNLQSDRLEVSERASGSPAVS